MTAPRAREQADPPSPPDRRPSPRGGHPSSQTASAARPPGLARLAGARRGLVCSARALTATALLAFAALVAPPVGHAQTETTLVANTGQGETSVILARHRLGQRFTTGPNAAGYSITGIDIVSVDPTGDIFFTDLCRTSRNLPDLSQCTRFTSPASFSAGTLSFALAGGTTVLSSTTYAVVVRAQVNNVSYGVTGADAEDSGQASGWSIANNRSTTSDAAPQTWTNPSNAPSLRIAILGRTLANALLTDTRFSSTPATNQSYETNDVVEVTVGFSSPVKVDTTNGSPRIALAIGSNTRYATYSAAHSTNTAIAFRYTVVAGDADQNGLSIAANALDLNGGIIHDENSDAVVIVDHAAVPTQPAHRVNRRSVIVDAGVRISSTPPAGGDAYGVGQSIEISVTFDEAVNATASTDFILDVADPKRAPLLRGGGTTTLVFGYAVEVGDSDPDGVSIGASDRTLEGNRDGRPQTGAITSARTGRTAILTHAALGIQSAHRVDGSRFPAVTITRGTDEFITEGETAVFALAVAWSAPTPLTVNVLLDEQVDRMVLPAGALLERTVVLQAGASSATLEVATDDDEIFELIGQLSATVEPGTGYTVGDPATATILVSDGDRGRPTPTNVAATPGHGPGEVVLSWDTPPRHAGFHRHQYRYRIGSANSSGWRDIPNSGQYAGNESGETYGANIAGYTVTGLVGGRAHTFQVRTFTQSTNDQDVSVPSNEATATPATASVAFAAGSYSVDEGDTIAITVRLSAPAGRRVTIPLHDTGTGGATVQGEADGDWSGMPEQLVFGPTDREATFALEAIRDTYVDRGEGAVLSFGPLPDGITAGHPLRATVTIIDNDANVDISVDAPADVRENAGRLTVNLRFATRANMRPDSDLALSYIVERHETAISGADYSPPSGTEERPGAVHFATLRPSAFSPDAAASTWIAHQSFSIRIIDDGEPERAERIVFRIQLGVDRSAAHTITVHDDDALPPDSPPHIRAHPKSQTSIQVSWTAPSNTGSFEVTGYKVETSDDHGRSWTDLVSDSGTPRTAYRHTGLSPTTTRHYRISAIGPAGTSGPSTVASATTLAAGPGATNAALPPPQDVNAEPKLPGEIRLSWWRNPDDPSHELVDRHQYRYRVRDAGDWTVDWTTVNQTQTMPPPGTTETRNYNKVLLQGLTAGTTYEFQVRAVDVDGGTSAAVAVLGTATGRQTVWIVADVGSVAEGEPLRFTVWRDQRHGPMMAIVRIDETGDMLPPDGRSPEGLWHEQVHFGDGNESIPLVLDTVDDGGGTEPDSRVTVEVMPHPLYPDNPDNEYLYDVQLDLGQAKITVTAARGSSSGSVAEPLTAAFEGVPATHDGATAFTFRLAFSEAVAVTPEAMRTHVLTVTGGAVTGAARVDGENGVWAITVTPDSREELSIALAPATECAADGAVCTSDGRALSNGAAHIVPGPGSGTGPAPLTATFPESVYASAQHTGPSDRPQVVVAFSAPVAAFGADTPSVSATGASVDGVQRLDKEGLEHAYVFFLTPEGHQAIVFRLHANRACPDGGICTADRRRLSNSPSATVAGPETGPPPLTAAFEGLPASHDGEDAFRVRVAFSEEIGIGFRSMRDASFTVDGGEVTGARRVDRRHDLWQITVAPDSDGDVTIALAAGRACGVSGAICTRGGDRRQLTNTPTATVAGPPVVPLTASFVEAPHEHDGETAFTLRIGFSEGISIGFRTFRDQSVSVSGGSVKHAKRVDRRKDLWKVTVKPGSRGDVTVTLAGGRACGTAGAVCTGDGRALSAGISTTVLGPAALTVADARAKEGTDETIDFTVSLSRATRAAVTVAYATADGTATAGSDYTATSGTLTFAAGETEQTVLVPVLDDAHDEGEETLTLRLSAATGAVIADGEATGTIKNTDPLQRAWLARFGRTVATHVTDAVGERLRDGSGASHVTVGGYRLPLEKRATGTAKPGATTEPETTTDRLASLLTGLAGMAGLGAGQTGGPGADPGGGGPGWDAWPDAGRDPRLGQSHGVTLDLRRLLLGSSFRLNLGAAATGSAGPRLTAWGRVAGTTFDGRDGKVSLEGDVLTGTVGVDGAWDRLLAGLAVAHSRGDGSFTKPGTADRGRGELETTLTSIHPYLRYAVNDRLDMWGVLGYGRGHMEMAVATGETLETDMALVMGAFGGRGILLPAGETGGFELATRTDAMLTRTSSDAVAGMVSADAEAHRLRLVLEGSRGFAWAEGRSLTPTMEVGLRHDWGDAETGFGLELGGRVHYADPALGLTIEAAVRGLLAHEDDDYQEWGASGSLRLAPGAGGQGLALTLAPTWGAASSGVNGLWSRQTTAGLAPQGNRQTPAGRLNAEIGYGVAAPFGTGFLTPYAGTVLSEGAARTYRVGGRLQMRGGWATGLTLNLEGTRQDPAGQQPVNQGLRLQLTWGF